MGDAVTVLYLAGTGRSGSTVLANICGQIEGWFAGGEIRYLWDRGLRQDRRCGCGVPFSECPVWAAVLERAFGTDVPDAGEVVRMLADTTRMRHVARPGAGTGAAADLATILSSLYGAIAEVTGARVVVDSSKLPSYGRLLRDVPNLDLKVVHLVRDPRAAAWSWLRKKALTDDAAASHMERIGALKSSLLWDVWNTAADLWWPEDGQTNVRVRYEDFVASPRAVVQSLAALCGEPAAVLPFTDDRTVDLAPTHTVAGNPDRLRSGPTALRADEAWRAEMPAVQRGVVSTLTAPLRGRYGYRGASVGGARRDETLPHEAPAWSRRITRIRRHWNWGRTQGFDRLVEEDNLDVGERIRTATAKAMWRHSHGVAQGTATPVWLVGVQRSGTNMVVRGLETSPEFEVHNENDRHAFRRFELRSDATIAGIIARSRHRYVLFKPLCDSHRTAHLLDEISGPPGRAIWAYRGVDGRARSAVAKFGDVNLRVLQRIAEGRGDDLWQAQRISDENRALLGELDLGSLTPHDGAALFWYVRNSLFFDEGLHERDDVIAVSYDMLVTDPERIMRAVCAFLDFPYSERLVAHVQTRSAGHEAPLALHPVIRRRCEDLSRRLDSAARASLAPAGGDAGRALG